MGKDRPLVRIAYLCAQYPAISHTFVLREVEALRRRGLTIDTFSVRRTNPNQLLAAADQFAYRSTFAILPARPRRLLGAHLRLLIGAPLAYVRTLALALRLAPPGLRGHIWQIFYFGEAVVLWDECRRRGIHHIHVHLANVAADVALLAAEVGSAVPGAEPWSWSFTMHGPAEFFDVGRFRLAEKLRRARFVVCISDFARSQLMLLCNPAAWAKLHVIHVGIPIEQFTNDGEQARSSPGDQLILFIGRQVPEKGQGVLLEAVALLAERGIDANVTLAGEGATRPELEHLARRLGIASRTSFPGAVSQDDIRGLYADASVFCLPSFAEGIPVVLMEAMAMEIPVVSTRITGVPELVDDGHTGLLVAPGRPDQLADALEQLLADSVLRREMGSAARERVIRDFNAEVSADELYALFQRELAPQRERPAHAEPAPL
jgi:colanic acid/amylovoran biosynthesis glycosyltransferase